MTVEEVKYPALLVRLPIASGFKRFQRLELDKVGPSVVPAFVHSKSASPLVVAHCEGGSIRFHVFNLRMGGSHMHTPHSKIEAALRSNYRQACKPNDPRFAGEAALRAGVRVVA